MTPAQDRMLYGVRSLVHERSDPHIGIYPAGDAICGVDEPIWQRVWLRAGRRLHEVVARRRQL